MRSACNQKFRNLAKASVGRVGRACERSHRGGSMLVAEVQAKGKRLQAKGQLRPAKFMMELLPAGSGKQTRVPDRRDFDEGQAGEDAWAASVLRGTEGMLGTDKEHEMFMILISEWSRANGLGALVRKALPDDRVRFRNIAPSVQRWYDEGDAAGGARRVALADEHGRPAGAEERERAGAEATTEGASRSGSR